MEETLYPLSPGIIQSIVSQISELYVRNEPADALIAKHNGRIPLNEYLCFTYGVKPNTSYRSLEALYFVAKSSHRNQVPYEISMLGRNTATFQNFWVENTGVLRKSFLGFTKKTHLFRNTFLYDPESVKIYRLYELRPYLHLPTVSPRGLTIWTSNATYYVVDNDVEDINTIDTCIVSLASKQKQISHLYEQITTLLLSCNINY